nr:unnamed protein product [Spirometra erinaceieuropaei]
MDARPQNQGRFALLSKVVKYMKQRHLERDIHPLSVEEILEETMLQDSPLSDVKWLETEALPNNPKIHSTADGKFVFKPNVSRSSLFLEFKQLWRAVSVEGMHEVKIEEYLRRNGITSMSADRKIFTLATKQKQAGRKRASNRPVKCLDNHVLPKSLSYRPPVNTSLAKRWVTEHGRRMIRALLQDCHLRLRKYNRVLSQAVTKCIELIGDDGVAQLQQVIKKRARDLRATRDAELAVKLQSISKSSQEENEVLVHNMSSKQLTPAQMKVLSHEACFNTTDADPVNLVATVESILKQTGESDESKHLIRQQVASLAMSHKPRAIITKAEQSALKTLRADTSIVILPADKGLHQL